MAAVASGMPNTMASYLVVAVVRAIYPITASSINDNVEVVSTKYRRDSEKLHHRVAEHSKRVVQHVTRSLERATHAEREWIDDSAQFLGGMAACTRNGNETGARYCEHALTQLGWGKAIKDLREQLKSVQESNLPPFDSTEGKLKRTTKIHLTRILKRVT